MTHAGDGALSGRERLTVAGILGLVAALTLADVIGDAAEGGTPTHIGIELAIIAAAVAAAGWLVAGYLRTRRELVAAERSIAGAHAEAARWREQHRQLTQGLAAAIDAQLDAWRLTAAEKEVAFLLLKGLSFKESAAVRGASERTVRQQALAVYAKAGVAGRAELAAFFLEDLLVPIATGATPAVRTQEGIT
ncbi:MAG: LuxR family transcriptional regulator [Deltaproteobacteria bacterium]|nr:LuxR family transcriptional regulator [Deltaproteobacteria bacterium]